MLSYEFDMKSRKYLYLGETASPLFLKKHDQRYEPAVLCLRLKEKPDTAADGTEKIAVEPITDLIYWDYRDSRIYRIPLPEDIAERMNGNGMNGNGMNDNGMNGKTGRYMPFLPILDQPVAEDTEGARTEYYMQVEKNRLLYDAGGAPEDHLLYSTMPEYWPDV